MSVQSILVEPHTPWAELLLAPGPYGARPPARARGGCPLDHGPAFDDPYAGRAPCCPTPCGAELLGVSTLLVLAMTGHPAPLGVARALEVLARFERQSDGRALDGPADGLGCTWGRPRDVEGVPAREWWLYPGGVGYCGDPGVDDVENGRHVPAGRALHHVPRLRRMAVTHPLTDVFALAYVLEARGLVKRVLELGASPESQGIQPWSLRTGLR